MLTKTTDSESVPAVVESLFRTREADLLERLEVVRGSLQAITENPKSIRFEVTLTTLWANEGEKNVTIKSKKGAKLENVLRQAEKKFKEINNRTDVQAKWFVLALAGTSGLGVVLSEDYVARFRG